MPDTEIYLIILSAVFPLQEGEKGVPEIQADIVADQVGPIVKDVSSQCCCNPIDLYAVVFNLLGMSKSIFPQAHNQFRFGRLSFGLAAQS